MLLGSGAALALPALPSLLPRTGHARAQAVAPPRRMVVITTRNGGLWNRHMHPPESAASEVLPHPLHDAHVGPLTSRVEGGQRIVSDVLTGPADRFTEGLLAKMNLIRGLDVPFYYGHCRHHLGNYGLISSESIDGAPDRETADQVLARTSLYGDEVPRRRLMLFANRGLSIELVDPRVGPAGGVQAAAEVGAQAIFDGVFVDEAERMRGAGPLDAVLESYRRVESGAFGAGRRMSQADRERLSLYMSQLSELREASGSTVHARCDDVRPRDDYAPEMAYSPYNHLNYRNVNGIVLAGFLCDSSRIAVLRTDDAFTYAMEADGGYHEVAHAAVTRDDAAHATRLGGLLRDGAQRFFAQAFLDLVSRLDAVPEGDGTMLDHTLVWWAQESGPETHQGDSLPIVTAGSAGGRFTTGNYYDFRDRTARVLRDEEEILAHEGRRAGANFLQWHTTYLDAFDVPRAAWQVAGRQAFSGDAPLQGFANYDRAAYDASCAAPLPGLLTI